MRFENEKDLFLALLKANPLYGDNAEQIESVEPGIKNDQQIYEVIYSGPFGCDTVKLPLIEVLLHIANQ